MGIRIRQISLRISALPRFLYDHGQNIDLSKPEVPPLYETHSESPLVGLQS